MNDNTDYKQRILLKVTSSRFWFASAAFLGSIATSIAGWQTDREEVIWIGLVCGALSSAIYMACKTVTGSAQANANTIQTSITSVTSQNVEAKSDDVMTVAAVLAPAPAENPAQPVMEDE